MKIKYRQYAQLVSKIPFLNGVYFCSFYMFCFTDSSNLLAHNYIISLQCIQNLAVYRHHATQSCIGIVGTVLWHHSYIISKVLKPVLSDYNHCKHEILRTRHLHNLILVYRNNFQQIM